MKRRTKIICTLGPATDSPEILRALVAAGLDVARLNFSHGTYDEHKRRLAMLREAAKEADRPIAALADLPGPKIRIGDVENGPIRLQRGQELVLTAKEVPGNAERVHLPTPAVFRAVEEGHSLFLDDGLIGLNVKKVTAGEIRTEVINGGYLNSHKGLTLPGIALDMPSLTEEDVSALHFIAQHDIDWVAVSFVRTPEDVRAVKKVLYEQGRSLPIMAKIEKHEAVECLDELLKEADGLMVARGDLGVERPIYQVPLLQKQIIERANRAGKPVVTATQMLDSMIRNPRPTRAEVTDVANAVLDGTDCVMLSGETAVGKYPVETVQLMREILLHAESSLKYKPGSDGRFGAGSDLITDAISQATCDVAREINAAAILTSTTSGFTARMVSRHRPLTPIIGVTSNPKTYRRLALSWGVFPILTPRANDTDETLSIAIEAAQEHGFVRENDLVVITAGVPTGISGNTNLLKVHRIGQPMDMNLG